MALNFYSNLVLASTSPYRRELLTRLCLPFLVVPPLVDEAPLSHETPIELATRLSLAKANAVANLKEHAHSLVIGSDQVAELDGAALGKPLTHEKAVLQLKNMQGKMVLFHSGVALVCRETSFSCVRMVTVKVQFRTLTNTEIEQYLQLEKPYDCAGSAKSEGLGITLLSSIDNQDPTSLIGLPLITLSTMLREAGVNPLLSN